MLDTHLTKPQIQQQKIAVILIVHVYYKMANVTFIQR